MVLFLQEEEVLFLDAGSLWGMDIYASEREIRRLLGDPEARVLSIGPAGENLVSFASLSNDFSRNAARGGVGAVMGSKNVKALAVKGTKDIRFFDAKGFRQSVKKAKEVIFKNPWVADQRKHGTPRAVFPVNENGIMPVSNFTRGKMEGIEPLLPVALNRILSRIYPAVIAL